MENELNIVEKAFKDKDLFFRIDYNGRWMVYQSGYYVVREKPLHARHSIIVFESENFNEAFIVLINNQDFKR